MQFTVYFGSWDLKKKTKNKKGAVSSSIWKKKKKPTGLPHNRLSPMHPSVYSDYPPHLEPAWEKFLVTAIKDWTIQNGLAIRPPPTFVPEGIDSEGVLATNAPVTLFPSLFPKTCFEEAKALQVVYNELYAAITSNESWLGKIVEE